MASMISMVCPQGGVGHEEGLARSHGVLAERARQWGLPQGGVRLGQPALTLEEMPVAVHQRDERNRHVEHGRRQARQPIERLFRR